MLRPRLLLFALLVSVGALVAAGCDSATTVQGEPEPRGGRGTTLSVTLLAEKPVAAIDAEFTALGFPIRARFAVAIYKIVYQTIDADGAATQASGALLVPQEAAGPRPMMSYQHGTLTARDEAPSAGGGEQVIGLAYATDGYLAVLPDLLGLGDSPGLHPYLHAATSASAVIDMLRAARDFAAMNCLELNGQLFITGYSQGGYTTMAAHRELEASYEDEFAVTASAPMAGPYDLSGVMADAFIDGREHPSPYYLAYTLLAYDAIYDLFEDPSSFLVAPYDRILPPLFDGTHSAGEINAAMPAVPSEILQPGLVEAFENDAAHPLRLRLQENDVHDWLPRALVLLYHCGQDRHVPPENSQVALEHLRARGAQVELVVPLPTGDQNSCAGPSLLLAKSWFDGMVQGDD